MELVEFLLARIGEDDAENQVGPEPESWCDRAEGLHLSHARVLAECTAKRRIVEFYAGQHGQPYALHFLALPYADHPDYQQEWNR